MLIIAVFLAKLAKEWVHKLSAKCQFDQKKWNIIKHKFYYHIKMGKEILRFGNIEIEKKKDYTAIKVYF